MKNFAIVIGRWHGAWRWIWYADIMHEAEDAPYMSFSALSRRGVLRKAKKNTEHINNELGILYIYDETTQKLEKA